MSQVLGPPGFEEFLSSFLHVLRAFLPSSLPTGGVRVKRILKRRKAEILLVPYRADALLPSRRERTNQRRCGPAPWVVATYRVALIVTGFSFYI